MSSQRNAATAATASTPASTASTASASSPASVSALVAAKMADCAQKVAGSGGNPEDAEGFYTDYKLYFNGARDFLSAAGQDTAALDAAVRVLDANLEFLQAIK